MARRVRRVRVEFWRVNAKERDHLEDLDVGGEFFNRLMCSFC